LFDLYFLIMESTQKTKKAAVWALAVLSLYTVWARAGTHPPFQPWMLFIAVVPPGLYFFLCPCNLVKALRVLVRDPVFWAGTLLTLLLTAHFLNTIDALLNIADTEALTDKKTIFSTIRLLHSDSGIQPLTWFVPAWLVILTTRHLFGRREVRVVLYVLVWNSTLCAVVGIVQYLTGAQRLLWTWTLPEWPPLFFASFDYTNHAAAYFYMNTAVSIGLVHDGIVRGKPPVHIVVWALCALLCGMASFFTLSRAGALVTTFLFAAAVVVMIMSCWRRLRSTAFIHAALILMLVLVAGTALFMGVGKGRLIGELKYTISGGQAAIDFQGRIDRASAAWDLFKIYPFLGSGGWGYRHLAAAQIPVKEWPLRQVPGSANVHCDPLQFLVEFGLLGALRFCATLGVLVFRVTFGGRQRPLFWWIFGALLLVFLHSLIDQPFRCPAILYEWCFLLAALPFWGGTLYRLGECQLAKYEQSDA
jgi:hypothetical protein